MLGAYVDRETNKEVFRKLFNGTKIKELEKDSAYRLHLKAFRRKCAYLRLVSHHMANVALFWCQLMQVLFLSTRDQR